LKLNFTGLLILVIVVCAGVGGAFGAGVATGKASAPTTAQTQAGAASGVSGVAGTTGATGTAGPAGAAGGRAGGAGALAAGLGVFGTVQSVTGNTLTVSEQSGTTVQVVISDTTTIRKTSEGARDDLKQGVEVLVTGQTGASGSMAASSIQIVPPGFVSAGQGRGGAFGAPTQSAGVSATPPSGRTTGPKPQGGAPTQ